MRIRRDVLLSPDSETLVFRVATACALLHALDDAFLNRQPGVPLGQHALAAAIAVVVGEPRLDATLAQAMVDAHLSAPGYVAPPQTPSPANPKAHRT